MFALTARTHAPGTARPRVGDRVARRRRSVVALPRSRYARALPRCPIPRRSPTRRHRRSRADALDPIPSRL